MTWSHPGFLPGVLSIEEEEEGSAFKRREYTIALKQDAKDLRPFEQTFVTSTSSGRTRARVAAARRRQGAVLAQGRNDQEPDV